MPQPSLPLRSGKPFRRCLPLAVAAAGLLALAACGSHGAAAAHRPISGPSSAGQGATSPSAAVTGTAAAALGTAHTALGTILTNATGATIYLLTSDRPGEPACTGVCLTVWPIVPASSPSTTTAAVGSTATLGSVTLTGGELQLTVDGSPVYTFAGDTSPGMTNGQGKMLGAGEWLALGPDGHAVHAGSTAPPPPPPATPAASAIEATPHLPPTITAPTTRTPVPPAPPTSHPAPPPSHPTPSTSTPAPSPSGIPQNDGGDHDGDNNGGPSDGDGNV